MSHPVYKIQKKLISSVYYWWNFKKKQLSKQEKILAVGNLTTAKMEEEDSNFFSITRTSEKKISDTKKYGSHAMPLILQMFQIVNSDS